MNQHFKVPEILSIKSQNESESDILKDFKHPPKLNDPLLKFTKPPLPKTNSIFDNLNDDKRDGGKLTQVQSCGLEDNYKGLYGNTIGRDKTENPKKEGEKIDLNLAGVGTGLFDNID